MLPNLTDKTFIMAQIFGILIVVCNAVSMQMKKKSSILIIFILGNLFSVISFILLQSYSGAIICFITMIQTTINYFLDKKGKEIPRLLITIYMIVFIVCGFIFYQTYIDILPIICSILYTMAIVQTKEKNIRRIILINAISWLIYDLVYRAFTGSISDMISIISTVIGIYRFDYKKKNKERKGKNESSSSHQ